MDANTQQVLQELKPGSEAQFFTDGMALQITKSGLTVAVVLCATACIYYFLAMMGMLGSNKRSLFAIVAFIASGVGGYLLYDKMAGIRVIDDTKPIIAITGHNLDYDIRRVGWSIPWASISSVELKTNRTFVKNSVEQIDYEIRVNTRPNAPITWKYEPSINNDMAAVKSLYEKKYYLVIDPEPLGISPPTLQMALEKYRTGM